MTNNNNHEESTAAAARNSKKKKTKTGVMPRRKNRNNDASATCEEQQRTSLSEKDSSNSIEDPRFASIITRPQFRKNISHHGSSSISNSCKGLNNNNNNNNNNSNKDKSILDDMDTKVELDERFSAVLTDPRFSIPGIGGVVGGMDKYGKLIGTSHDKKKEKKKKTKQKEKEKKRKNENGNIPNMEGEEDMSSYYRLKAKHGEGGIAVLDMKTNEKVSSHHCFKSTPPLCNENLTKHKKAAEDSENINDNDVNQEEESDTSYDTDDDHVSLSSGESNDFNQDPEARIAYLTALSRGEVSASSSSPPSSSIDSDSDSDGLDIGEHGNKGDDRSSNTTSSTSTVQLGILDPNYDKGHVDFETTKISSQYLALCNIDWSNVRAVDLYVILSSFTPRHSNAAISGGGGSSSIGRPVRHVTVYLSNFGQGTMAKEAISGPDPCIFKKKKGRDEQNQNAPSLSLADKNSLSNESKSNDRRSNDEELVINISQTEKNGSSDDESDAKIHKNCKSYSHFPNEAQASATHGRNDITDDNFNVEALRAYEASKLLYYFAIAEFSDAQMADTVYAQLDGLELEHSSTAMDIRVISPDDVENIVKNRPVRDRADTIPSTYELKNLDFVVSALQNSNVRCTWDEGDVERNRLLTNYYAWNDADGDDQYMDMKKFLDSSNSDNSDVDSDSTSGDSEENAGENSVDQALKMTKKACKMRKVFGLDDSDDGSVPDAGDGKQPVLLISEVSGKNESSYSDDQKRHGRTVSYTPGRKEDLDEKIRSKLNGNQVNDAPSPWEAYKSRRKEKRRERRNARRQNARGALPKDVDANDNHSIGKKLHGHDILVGSCKLKDDSGFTALEEKEISGLVVEKRRQASSREELELLCVGDTKDDKLDNEFHIRELISHGESIKIAGAKRWKGAKGVKNRTITDAISGSNFRINTADERFAALMNGKDARFGIDKTDLNYKDTPAMRALLSEQIERHHKTKLKTEKTADVTSLPKHNCSEKGDLTENTDVKITGLVKRIKRKIGGKIN